MGEAVFHRIVREGLIEKEQKIKRRSKTYGHLVVLTVSWDILN